MATTNKPQSLLQELKNLRLRANNAPDSLHFGICAHLCPENLQMFRLLAAQWPKYSGNPKFPIPHSTTTPIQAFVVARATYTLWDANTRYGRDRKELLNFCIKYLEAQRAKPPN